MRILNYAVYTWSKYLRILNYALYVTSDRKCDSPFESEEKRHGCVWVPCQSNTHVCCLRFLCMCSALYHRRKWLEGHTSSGRPPKHDSEVKSFIHRFCCVICENRNWKTPLYRDLRCAFQITFCDVIWHTHCLFCVFWILIQNVHLELRFKIRTLPSCENSLCVTVSNVVLQVFSMGASKSSLQMLHFVESSHQQKHWGGSGRHLLVILAMHACWVHAQVRLLLSFLQICYFT